MKTTLKLVSAITGGLMLVAPVVASAQMIDTDNVQNEVKGTDGIEISDPADAPDQANVPDVPDGPGAPEAPEAPGLSN